MSVVADPELAFEGEQNHPVPLNKTSIARAASLAIPGASLLFGFTVKNTNAAAQFLWVFDAASLPANGTAPSGPIFDLGAGTGGSGLFLPPRTFFAGIVLANSTSATTFTTGAADCWFDVQYA